MSGTDPHALLTLSLRLLCAGIVLRSLQVLLNWRELADQRLLGWDPVARTRRALAWRLRAVLTYPGVLLLLVLQTVAATVGLVARTDAATAAWPVAALFLLQLWFNYRLAVVYHAADTMFLIGLGAVLAGTLDPATPRLQEAALAFFGLQVLLAYFMSGKTKVTAAAWRDGSHLIEIFRCSAWRMERFGGWLGRRPGLARVAARGVIFLELFFPFSLLAPPSLFALTLASGALFHASVAVLMGLPGFFWSFVAAYPALWFLHQRLQAAF